MIDFDEILDGFRKAVDRLMQLSNQDNIDKDDVYVIAVFLKAGLKQLEDYHNAALKTQRWK